jgi:uncharacterized membrane protein YedE/YeeE
MLLANGRILGVSGIVGGLFDKKETRKGWRYLFILGLVTGGLLLRVIPIQPYPLSVSRSPLALIIAGLLVGYGSRLGGGCTSGHGVCGVSRLSPRGLVATALFMAAGAATVFLIQHWGGQL